MLKRINCSFFTSELPEIRERSGVSWKTRVVPVENTHIPRDLHTSLCGQESPVEGRPQRKVVYHLEHAG